MPLLYKNMKLIWIIIIQQFFLFKKYVDVAKLDF